MNKKLVFHTIQKYIGFLDGKTRLPQLFEDPEDTIGYRIRLPDGTIKIASSKNLLLDSDTNYPIVVHKFFLEQLGIPYKGTRTPEESKKISPTRTSWCWNCKRPLTSQVNLECCACDWILCQCGACGCGHNAYLKDKMHY
jgi:hypothetical protein